MKMKTVEYYDCEVWQCTINHKTKRGAIRCQKKLLRAFNSKSTRRMYEKRNYKIYMGRQDGHTYKTLARIHNLSPSRVRQICNNYEWELRRSENK